MAERPPPKWPTMSITFPQEMRDDLRDIAQSRKCSISELVREGCEMVIMRYAQELAAAKAAK